MVIGFLCSRSILTGAMGLLVANAFLQSNVRQRVKYFLNDPVSVAIAALFIMPFVSGLWSSNYTTWLQVVLIKLPLLLLPFALVQQVGLTAKKLNWFLWLWIVAIVAGSVWSVAQYLPATAYFNEAYRSSQTIPTPAANDHIRFSMAVVIALLFWLKIEKTGFAVQWQKNLLRTLAVWLVVYLHLLGAKTGLLGFYAVVVPLLLYQLYTNGKQQLARITLVVVISLPALAYLVIPTFRHRMHYVLFEMNNWRTQEFAGRFSDANRLASIRSGWGLFKANALTGVGYGDIRTEATKWYQKNAPSVQPSEQFLPLNQWFMSGSGAGLLAVLLFTIAIAVPLCLKRWQQQPPAWAFMCFMSLVFLYESTIDDQFGVFLFCFFTLYWNTLINIENN